VERCATTYCAAGEFDLFIRFSFPSARAVLVGVGCRGSGAHPREPETAGGWAVIRSVNQICDEISEAGAWRGVSGLIARNCFVGLPRIVAHIPTKSEAVQASNIRAQGITVSGRRDWHSRGGLSAWG